MMSRHNPNLHNHRVSLRLRDYDYTRNGAYFVTICTHKSACLFGDVIDGEMVLGDCGVIAQSCWNAIPTHYPMVNLDVFVIMPNHMHGVIVIKDNDIVGAQYIAPLQLSSQPKRGAMPNNVAPNSLGAIVRSFKAAVTRRIRQLPNINDHPPIWQRNYYEHIIRSEASLQQIRTNISSNPARWAGDSLFLGSET